MILGIFTSSPKFAVLIERLGKMIGLLCNGSTTDFDSVCLGSNPGNPTFERRSFLRLPFFMLPMFAPKDYPVSYFLSIADLRYIILLAQRGITMKLLFVTS